MVPQPCPPQHTLLFKGVHINRGHRRTTAQSEVPRDRKQRHECPGVKWGDFQRPRTVQACLESHGVPFSRKNKSWLLCGLRVGWNPQPSEPRQLWLEPHLLLAAVRQESLPPPPTPVQFQLRVGCGQSKTWSCHLECFIFLKPSKPFIY